MDNSNAFVLANQETQALLRGRISDLSRGIYELKLISFIVWLFDNRSNFGEYVNSTLLVRMEEADATDEARRIVARRPSKKAQLSLR